MSGEHPCAGEVNKREVVPSRFFVARGDGSKAFEIMEEALHQVASRVEGAG